jgi:phosphoribosylformylglycinamidine cyclo-ligase
MDYKDSGVDIEKGDEFVKNISGLCKSTHNKSVLTGIGHFAAAFKADFSDIKDPLLVSSTDGVGTKLNLAQMAGIHDTIGIDLVAMSVNDLICLGAKPLFFLDYFSTGKLDPEIGLDIVKGIAEGCRQSECALIGGETAEMPSFYQQGEYDLAGFAVGVVDKSKLINGKNIKKSDIVLGLHSSGPHSNGYSLIRKILFEKLSLEINSHIPELEDSIAGAFLKPTRIYVKGILGLLENFTINGICNVTGGGIEGNLKRIIPDDCRAIISKDSWSIPPIFNFLQDKGEVSPQEMLKVFNCGIGLIIVVPRKECSQIVQNLLDLDYGVSRIGEIESNSDTTKSKVVLK